MGNINDIKYEKMNLENKTIELTALDDNEEQKTTEMHYRVFSSNKRSEFSFNYLEELYELNNPEPFKKKDKIQIDEETKKIMELGKKELQDKLKTL